MCTSQAVEASLCNQQDIGKFIFFSDDETTMDQTSFWTASVALNQTSGPVLPRPRNGVVPMHISRQEDTTLNPSPDGLLRYTAPIQYQVRKTGYYCVGKLMSVMGPCILSPFC